MRAFLAAIAFLALASPVSAATITFERPFSLVSVQNFEGANDPTLPPDLRMEHWLDSPIDVWNVPMFDPSLGTPTLLTLTIDALTTIAGDLEFGDLQVIIQILLINNLAMIGGGGITCTEPCTFLFQTPFEWNDALDPSEPVSLDFTFHADSFAFFEIAASANFRTEFTGVARATYEFEPAATPIPEPM